MRFRNLDSNINVNEWIKLRKEFLCIGYMKQTEFNVLNDIISILIQYIPIGILTHPLFITTKQAKKVRFNN